MLVVAGSLKRDDPGRPEDQVLMRSLRDFNIPKIVTDDVPVFMGLIGDLFPALDVPRKRDLNFESFVRQAVLDLRLQAEDNFVLKVRPNNQLCLHCHQIVVFLNHFYLRRGGSVQNSPFGLTLVEETVCYAGSDAVVQKASTDSVPEFTRGQTLLLDESMTPREQSFVSQQL